MLDEYQKHQAQLTRLGGALEGELRTLLQQAAVPVQLLTWRLKTPASLAQKLARPDRTYRQLWDVTDLVALRVATFFEDHLDQVCRALERHFVVDFAHSAARSNPAGYRSVHYVCSTREGPHPDFRFEIQLRTVLQHAWAEVEHDLGYKVHDEVPAQIRRRFSRVAALLEIADQEFVAIRRELAQSREEALATLQRSGALPLDLLSLEALVRQPELERLDATVAKSLGVTRGEETFFPGYLVSVLRLAGLGSTSEVLAAAATHAADLDGAVKAYFEFARRALNFTPDSVRSVSRGYGLLFVALLHVVRGDTLELNKVARLTRLYLETDFPGDERTSQRVAGELLETLRAR